MLPGWNLYKLASLTRPSRLVPLLGFVGGWYWLGLCGIFCLYASVCVPYTITISCFSSTILMYSVSYLYCCLIKELSEKLVITWTDQHIRVYGIMSSKSGTNITAKLWVSRRLDSSWATYFVLWVWGLEVLWQHGDHKCYKNTSDEGQHHLPKVWHLHHCCYSLKLSSGTSQNQFQILQNQVGALRIVLLSCVHMKSRLCWIWKHIPHSSWLWLWPLYSEINCLLFIIFCSACQCITAWQLNLHNHYSHFSVCSLICRSLQDWLSWWHMEAS